MHRSKCTDQVAYMYLSEMARNTIKSDFQASKMIVVKFFYKVVYWSEIGENVTKSDFRASKIRYESWVLIWNGVRAFMTTLFNIYGLDEWFWTMFELLTISVPLTTKMFTTVIILWNSFQKIKVSYSPRYIGLRTCGYITPQTVKSPATKISLDSRLLYTVLH